MHAPPLELLSRYQRSLSYLNEGLIRLETPDLPQAKTRKEWMECFLPRLGHPELAFEAVHVAGTSGKGSVSTMLAEILRAAGYCTGLHVSPYLQVATEKLWVDGVYASVQELCDLVEWIRPHAEAVRGPEVPLHGMASVAIALEHLRRRAARLAVIEVGVGGRDDLTNVLKTRVAVVGPVGLDHLKTLGPTLDDIARHKAGIIKAGCRAVVLDGASVEAAQRQANLVGVPLRVVTSDLYRSRLAEDGKILLSYDGPLLQLEDAPLAMRGSFQAQNAALALAAVEELVLTGYAIDAEHAVRGLSTARLPGRMELLSIGEQSPCPVLLDGAHNPDKLAAMSRALPELSFSRLHLVYGALASRAPDEQLSHLMEMASTVVFTEPEVYAKPARPIQEISERLRPRRQSTIHLERDPLRAMSWARDRASSDDLIVVTGSIYLCGQIRNLWYPEASVLEAQRSWI
jgi:dihydrofolate synthase / folylpolyglutamate synthase